MNQELGKIKKWAKKLENNAQLQKDLDAAFTSIGIRDEHISADEPKRSRFIKDLLWGNIATSPALFSVIDSPFFQRQRLITKLGFTSLAYPGATHTLLEHGLGCLNLIQTIMMKPVNTSHGIPRYENNNSSVPVELENIFYEHAVLLHDIGQPVYGTFTTSLLLNPQNACYDHIFFGNSSLKEIIESAKQELNIERPEWLSEESLSLKIVSALFLLSNKFRGFYDRLWCFREGQNRLPVAPSIMLAGCILGASINGNKNLFWDLFHGPLGVKTIDELLRDTKNCGVQSPVDHQRMLATADLLYISKNDTGAENYESDDPPLLRAYVVDQFDPYVFRELKMSIELIRSRVYAHSWRKAFKDLYQMMLLSAEPTPNTTFLNASGGLDYLKLWSMFEEKLLEECKINTNHQTSLIASRLIFRQAPKRCLSLVPEALEVKGIEFIKDENKYNHKLFLRINVIMFDKIFAFFKDKAQSEGFSRRAKKEIFDALNLTEIKSKAANFEAIELYIFVDNSYYDHDVAIVGFEKEGKYKYCREKLIELDTKSIHNRIFFYTTNEIAEISYLVLKKMLYQEFSLKYAEIAAALKDTNWSKTIEDRKKIFIRPHTSNNYAFTFCDFDHEKVNKIEELLSEAGFYDNSPCICEVTGEQRTMTKKMYGMFKNFEGDGGYVITEDSIQAFVEQFPPKLREEALSLVSSVKVLTRQALSDHLTESFTSLLKEYNELLLVPLSESSGKLMSAFLGEPREHIYSRRSMPDALGIPYEKIADKKFAVLIYDDNLISGTQALAQLKFWEGNGVGTEEVNINTTEMPSEKLAILKTVDLYFSFNVTWAVGRQRVEDYLRENGFKDVKKRFLFASEIEGFSRLANISTEFKQYLKEVGETVYKQKMKGEQGYSEEIMAERAKKRALGFDNLEGLFVTPLSVPTATVTALWCPGLMEIQGMKFPWKPLFIRTNSFKHFVW